MTHPTLSHQSDSPYTGEIRNTPRLALRKWNGGRKAPGVLHYVDSSHATLPHIIKFSGGRSSALLLMTLLENDLLRADRGDVILFTNTSAEHPSTYDFVAKMKRFSEKRGVPFFIAEFQTAETVLRGKWRRFPTYRLVNHKPYCKKANPQGYRYRGEIFEEAIAWVGMMPSVFTRTCTVNMKMHVTRGFLTDYFATAQGIPLLGHTSKVKSKIETLFQEHKYNRGNMSQAEFTRRWNFLNSCSTYRPKQRFSDFTSAQMPTQPNKHIADSVYGSMCTLFGEDHARFLTFLGFRAEEQERYNRMMSRNNGESTPGHNTHPPGEYSYAPLVDLGYQQQDVLDFWDQQPAHLRPRLPRDINLSNCVYCFLKGPRKLREIEAKIGEFEKTLPKKLREQCKTRNTPRRAKWWADVEKRHQRRASKRNGSFGMLGLDSGYESIMKGAKSKRKTIAIAPAQTEDLTIDDFSVSCDCTD